MSAGEAWDRVGAIRRARRVAGLSQRAMAERAGVSSSTVARAESRDAAVSLEVVVALLAVAGLRLAVVDGAGELVTPMRPHTMRDRAGRFFPAHLDTVPAHDYTPSGSQRHYARQRPLVTFARGGLHDYGATLRGEGWVRPSDHVTEDELERLRQQEWEFRRSLLPPLTSRELPPCECGPECELTCVASCSCQCEPANLAWGSADGPEGFTDPVPRPGEPLRMDGPSAPDRDGRPARESRPHRDGRPDRDGRVDDELGTESCLGDSSTSTACQHVASVDSASAPQGGAEAECVEVKWVEVLHGGGDEEGRQADGEDWFDRGFIDDIGASADVVGSEVEGGASVSVSSKGSGAIVVDAADVVSATVVGPENTGDDVPREPSGPDGG